MRRILGGIALALMVFAAPLAGQETRGSLLDAALASSDPGARLDLLVQALNPALGAPDSAWAVGAFSMAFRLTEAGREEEAGHWLRWAAREGASVGLTPEDFPGLFPPPLVSAYNRARAQVEAQASPTDDVVTSSWSWPGAYAAGADGALVVRVEGAGAGFETDIEGSGTVADGQTVAMAAGTVRILVSGDGVEPVSVRREVLPGVTRTLTVAATPVLFPGAQARAEGSLVRLRRDAGGGQICSSGVVAAGSDGLVVAPLSALEGSGVELVAPDGRVFTSIEVPVRDSDQGVGVARLGSVGLSALETAEAAEGPTWALFHDGCGTARTEQVALGAAAGDGLVGLDGAPASSSGGAVLDQQGRLLALGLGTTAVTAARIADLVEQARNRPVVNNLILLRK